MKLLQQLSEIYCAYCLDICTCVSEISKKLKDYLLEKNGIKIGFVAVNMFS